MPRNNELERRALQMILEAEDRGIFQSEMWKSLGVTSREGSRLALKFEERDIIERKKILHEGRWTYKLYSKTKPITIDSISDCPCMICDELDKCFTGGQMSPIHCQLLTDWINANTGTSEAERII